MLKVLLCAIVISCSESLFAVARARRQPRCFDCVSIRSCEPGLRYALMLVSGDLPNESRTTFYNALCGYDKFDPKVPKVCCSAFPAQGLRAGVLEEEDTSYSDESLEDPIETHPNIGLLPSQCGDIDGTLIINGEEAKLYEFPWMTLIIYNTSRGPELHCGGSIINSRYILTAAHCVADRFTGKLKRNVVAVRIGELDYNEDYDCQGEYQTRICESKIQDIDIDEMIPHEDFNGNQILRADIALLRLSENIVMENNAAPICLPVYRQLRNTHLAGMNATVAGWGITEYNTESSRLMKVNIPIKSGDDCSSYYDRYENQRPIEKVFCAGQINKDSCSGDSGGPLMIESEFNRSIRMVQFGIVSYGPKRCGSRLPGVYTDVTKYMGWILDNIKP